MSCSRCGGPTFGTICSYCAGEKPKPVDAGLTPIQALNAIVDAWESLEGNKRHTANDVQRWLIKEMKPAIDEARLTLGRSAPTSDYP